MRTFSTKPLVSVIIPCYNHGNYVHEAIQSVRESAGDVPYEIVVVDDGSTDAFTRSQMELLARDGMQVVHQTNQGLAAARNNGIKASEGKYIISLDSDNKLSHAYFSKGIDILEKSPEFDVVFGNPMFFENEKGLRIIGDFDFSRIIKGNYVDACAVFRKSAWEKAHGYDGNMPAMGHEDWEFWIHIFLKGGRFFFLNELCFYYRNRMNSMSKTSANPNEKKNRNYIYRKHGEDIINILCDERRNALDKITRTSNYLKSNKLKSIVKIVLELNISA